jgi:hypothetical protein
MPSRERVYATVALAVAWAALAAVFGAYAVVRESAGALIFALLLLWLTQSAWAAAWREDGDEDAGRRDIPYRF